MSYEEDIINGKLEVTMESAIPALDIDESKFIATGKDRYLIVFVDMVSSTKGLRDIDGDMDEVTGFFQTFHEKTIRGFREEFGNSFKFKMLGDGLLFFLKEDNDADNFDDDIFLSLFEKNVHLDVENKCKEFHEKLVRYLKVRTIAGYGTLIEVNVGLSNHWTDYYGVAINDIVHASKDMGSEFKWIEE